MIKNIIKQAKIASKFLLAMIILTGFIYPEVVTGIAQFAFPWRANGSLVQQNDKVVGSLLIGQAFSDPRYFWSRPSATTPFPYNAEHSSGSNLGPSNPELIKTVESRIQLLKKADPKNKSLIPVDLVTASASGLDPHISIASAYYQVSRIAKARKVSEKSVIALIQIYQNKHSNRYFGEQTLNVLLLNLALDNLNS